MTNKQVEALLWYLTRSNRGRGRLTAESKALMRLGLLKLTWTSATEWCLTITDKGRAALEDACK